MGWGGLSGSKSKSAKNIWMEEHQKQLKEAEDQFEKYAQLRAQGLSLAYARGQNECLAFCAAVHKALPREIRDMVYDHLIPPRRQHHVFEALDENGKPRISINPLVSVSFFDPRSRMPAQVSSRSDVWKYREYTGPIVAKEIAERWYHTGLFILDAEDCLIPKFLTTDVWEHDAVPAEAVRHVRINIALNQNPFLPLEPRIDESLQALESITNKVTEITLQLSRLSRYARWPLLQLLRAIRPTVHRLWGKGFRKVVVRQRFSDDFPGDVTHFFHDLDEVSPDKDL